MYQFIHQQQDLQNVLNLMDQSSIYGLDTEFIKVDTLWPKLGVFQINISGKVYCSEDIDLIYHYAQQKTLKNVFDTQVGMSFLGHGLQVSYQNALKTMLDVDIEKDQTRSDWLARPLSPEQLMYAANDVEYIMQLSENGRLPEFNA